MKKLLLVEDETAVRESLSKYLGHNGHHVQTAASLKAAENALTKDIDLIILDWNLPDGEGVNWLRDLRRRGFTMPVIFLSARAEVLDKILGLEAGATDYMTKPFEPRELLARLRIQLKILTPAEAAASVVQVGNAQLELQQATLKIDNFSLVLSPLELNFLKVIMSHPNKIFSRDELYDRVWGYDFMPDGRAVDHLVSQLRKKIPVELIETVRGHGYRVKGVLPG